MLNSLLLAEYDGHDHIEFLNRSVLRSTLASSKSKFVKQCSGGIPQEDDGLIGLLVTSNEAAFFRTGESDLEG
jgi:hypothetical protein